MNIFTALLCLPWLAAGTLAAKAPAPTNDQAWVRLAVVAASQNGMPGDKPLRFAYRDGERLEKMLTSVGQIEPENLFLIKAEDRAGFQSALAGIGKRIADLKGQNRKVFLQFYYSGHGGAHNFHFRDGQVSFDAAKQALGGDRADARVYVLDVCFGASFFTAKGFRTAPPVQLQMEMDRAAKGEVTISSSSGNEQAYEVRALGGSIFTSHWIMALRGAGDSNRDGQVTLFEAYNYAYDRTSGYSAETLDRPQHPAYQIDLTGARDMMLARLLQSSTGILFKHCPTGLYNLIDLQRGMQIGELRIPDGEDFTLALEPGHYRVQYQPVRGSSLAAEVDLPAAGMTPLAFSDFSVFQPPTPDTGFPKGQTEPRDDPDSIEDASSSEPVREAGRSEPKLVQPGLLARIGYGAWLGWGAFSDGNLEKALAQKPETDEYFGFDGGFSIPRLRSGRGLEIGLPLAEKWNAALRLGHSRAEYAWKSTGSEPLHSVSDSLRTEYPVSLASTYRFSDQYVGALLGRTFRVTQRQSFGLDGSAAWIFRTVTANHRVQRPLYASAVKSQSEASAEGYRLEAGAFYLVNWTAPGLNRSLVTGLRLSPYFCDFDTVNIKDGPSAFASREWGIMANLVFQLPGLRATLRR